MKQTARKARERKKKEEAEAEKQKKAEAKAKGEKYVKPTVLSLKDYIETYFKIVDKQSNLIPLHMNDAQKVLYDVFKEHYNNDKPCKIIILKARQMGFSTMTEALIGAVTMTSFFINGLIMAHNTDATNNIYDMVKRYYDNLPPNLKPMVKYSNSKLLRFENPTNDPAEKEVNPGLRSSIRVSSAEQKGVGRSATYKLMHLSEIAFWKEQDGKTVQDQLTGLLQTLPQSGFSLLVIESTANGYNYFKQMWDMAVAGDSDYIPLFFPWYQMPEYRREYSGEELTAEENDLKAEFGLDNEQIMWRRYAIRTLCGGDINQFKQEYPATPEEAFIQSGNPFFDPVKIQERLRTVRPPMDIGEFTEMGGFYERQNGCISIWEHPVPGHVYCLGADTAGEGSDYFVGYVLDKTDGGTQVAKYRAQMDERQFVQQIYNLGRYYNYAMIGPETNFSSYPTLRLQEMGYENLYVRETVDTYTPHIMKKFGFKTTSTTRPLILDKLKEVVNYHAELIKDPAFFHEALSFVKNEVGRPEAATGAHDDCVFAMAISWAIMPQASDYTPIEEEILPKDYEEVRSFLEFTGG